MVLFRRQGGWGMDRPRGDLEDFGFSIEGQEGFHRPPPPPLNPPLRRPAPQVHRESGLAPVEQRCYGAWAVMEWGNTSRHPSTK